MDTAVYVILRSFNQIYEPHKWHQRELMNSDINKDTNSFVDGEYGADGSQTVDVAGAIQGVKAHHILTLWPKTHRDYSLSDEEQ